MRKGSPRFWLVVKTFLAAVVVAAVGWQFAKLLRNPALQEHEFTLRWEYLIPAGLLYLGCHCVWGTFWVQLLWNQGVNISWSLGMRAYFVSQLAKYIPGKAWVILWRVALLRKHNAGTAIVAVTATYETLTSMATGAMLAVCLLPWAGLGLGLTLYHGLALAAVGLMPLAAGAVNILAARMVKNKRGPDAKPFPAPSFLLLCRGMLQAMVGWLFLGLSLWLTVAGLSSTPTPLNPELFLEDLSAVAISYVAGFAAFILPGGFGAREAVLQKVLAVQLLPTEGGAAAPVAAIIAIVLRIIWTSFEVAISIICWIMNKQSSRVASEPGATSERTEA
jgi:hypothetical protein